MSNVLLPVDTSLTPVQYETEQEAVEIDQFMQSVACEASVQYMTFSALPHGEVLKIIRGNVKH